MNIRLDIKEIELFTVTFKVHVQLRIFLVGFNGILIEQRPLLFKKDLSRQHSLHTYRHGRMPCSH